MAVTDQAIQGIRELIASGELRPSSRLRREAELAGRRGESRNSLREAVRARVVECVDHLHEHFLDPCVMEHGRCRAPRAPGYSMQIGAESLERHAFRHGEAWAEEAVRA